MRVIFLGGTGPVGLAGIPHLLAGGHEVAVAHTGAHEPGTLGSLKHLHGQRDLLLAPDGAVERWRPDAIIDTFAGGATAEKAQELGALAERIDAGHLVAVSSIDVYRHCADAGVDGNEPTALARDLLPLHEDAPRRTGPSPGGGMAHDNVAMEDALCGAKHITILRPGAIYGPQLHRAVLREWYLVERVARGQRALGLPAGGGQLFHRVALDRVGRAIAASLEYAPTGRWAVNVADPQDLTFGALAALVAGRLSWDWEAENVAWEDSDHPWNVRHPVLVDTSRLRDVLGVATPEPRQATEEQIYWLWQHRDDIAAFMSED